METVVVELDGEEEGVDSVLPNPPKFPPKRPPPKPNGNPVGGEPVGTNPPNGPANGPPELGWPPHNFDIYQFLI